MFLILYMTERREKVERRKSSERDGRVLRVRFVIKTVGEKM
jgi:hypothetical protein